MQDAPHATTLLNARKFRVETPVRTVPEAFKNTAGTMVQKTGHGQGSPYIRGFTGYRNLFLFDGVRLNNSVFRDGPKGIHIWDYPTASTVAQPWPMLRGQRAGPKYRPGHGMDLLIFSIPKAKTKKDPITANSTKGHTRRCAPFIIFLSR